MYIGSEPPLAALVMSAAAPTSNSHLHTDRCPMWQAMYMEVQPSSEKLVMSATRSTSISPCTPTGGPPCRR